jgi:hypothetical protein
MTRKPTLPKPQSSAEAALANMTRAQLQAILRLDPKTAVPGIHRADDDALRAAVRTYLRMGRLTEAQVIEGGKA